MKTKLWRRVRPRLQFAAAHVDGFCAWLRSKGYTERSVRNLIGLLATWTDWISRRRFDIRSINGALIDSQLHIKHCNSRRLPPEITVASVGAGRLFAKYLWDRGILAPEPTTAGPEEKWPRLRQFRAWMRQHRGVTESTLDLWQRHIVRLLETLGTDSTAYTATAIRDFVLERASTGGRARARIIAGAVRAFLRFLVSIGECATGREHAVPTFAQWRLASIPQHLSAEEVSRVLEGSRGRGNARDRAILLLLLRLGLRSGDVAKLRLGDVDWRNARIAISGKERRALWLPLTQEIGDALLTYLRTGRPARGGQSLFITSVAPYRPITRTTVKCVVQRALARANVNTPSKGAHVLRHTAAAAMLANGVSLPAISAVLRHRSPDTTMLYAKVNLSGLAAIAQPWVGRLPC